MTSLINPNNIDTAYPVAGQDNDSQGFRDNFTNIVTALESAKDEIEEIQEKALLKTAISGTLDNDMDGETLSNVTLIHPRLEIVALGSYASGVVGIDLDDGAYHTATITGDVSIDVDHVAASGEHSSFYIEITVPDATGTVDVTLPVVADNLIIGSHPRYLSGNVLSLPDNSSYLYYFITRDNGATWILVDCLYTAFSVPADPLGSEGDKEGDFVADSSGYLYVCIADYDGSTSIWSRTATPFSLTVSWP